MNKYLASDLDGTLLFPRSKDGFVCKENKEAIKSILNNLIIVSGRGEDFVKKVCQELDSPQTFIACNGSSIYLNGKELFKSYLDKTSLNKLINYVSHNFAYYRILLFDSNCALYTITNDLEAVNNYEQMILNINPYLGYTTNKDQQLISTLLNKENTFIKVSIFCQGLEKEKLVQYLKQENYPLEYVICNRSIEITPKGVTKGSSLTKLIDYLHLDHNKVLVIGDDGNDISMFNNFSNSFLINNDNNKNIQSQVKNVLKEFKEINNYLKEE